MEPDALIATFSARYQSQNPRAFWDQFLLAQSSAKNTLEWAPTPRPKVNGISDNIWRGKICQWYGDSDKLSKITLRLKLIGEFLQTQFHVAEVDAVRNISIKILTFSTLVKSFKTHVLEVFDNKNWVNTQKLLSIHFYKRDFVKYLPVDTVLLIFKQIPFHSLNPAQRVCKKWHELIKRQLWTRHLLTVNRLAKPLYDSFGGTNDSGDNLKIINKGMVFGTILNPMSRREKPAIWDKAGQLHRLMKIRYLPSMFHLSHSNIFVDDTHLAIFKKLGNLFNIEFWKNYLSEIPQLLWHEALSNISDIHLIKLTNSHPLNSKLIVCEGWEYLHINNIKRLFKLNLDEKQLIPLENEHYRDIYFIDPKNILCYKAADQPLLYKKLDENGNIANSYKLEAIDPKNIYYWCDHYIAFWATDQRRQLLIYQTGTEAKSDLIPLAIPVESQSIRAPQCSGWCPAKPLAVWPEWRQGGSYLRIHNFTTEVLLPVKLPNPIGYIHFISPSLMLTCTYPQNVKRIDIQFWDLNTLNCLKHITYDKYNEPFKPQFFSIHSGFGGFTLAGQLFLIKYDDQIKKIEITEFPTEIQYLEASLGTLFIIPKTGLPIIATI